MYRTRKLLSLGVAAIASLGILQAQVPTELQKKNQLNVLTYNVHNGIGMDKKTDYARIGRFIRRTGADIVAVQEVDSATRRSKGRYVLGEIAAEALMYPTFGPAIDFDGGKYGIGVLSREKPLSVNQVPLPGSEERRTLLVVEFEHYVMGCIHLSLTEKDLMASLPLIREEAKRHKKPFVLAGDWNAEPQSAFVKEIQNDFTLLSRTKNPTWPADKPQNCIDYIALYKPTGQNVVGRRTYVWNEQTASDHRPVYAQLQFKTPAEQLVYHTPYLQNPTNEGVTVMFQTNAISHCWVEYGTDTLNLTQKRDFIGGQEVCFDIENKIRLDGLEPGQTYYYRVCAQEIIDYQSYSKTFGETYKSPFYKFTLPANETTDFTALIFNDLHENGATIDAFSQLARQIPHDIIIFNGDCLPEPFDRQYALKHIHILADAFNSAETPTFFIRGNHEIRNAYSAGMPSLFDQPGGNTYGAFNWGDTRFVLLDCGEDKPDDHWVYYGLNDFTQLRHDQVDFLKREISSKAFKKAKRRVLIHHIPLWGNTDKYSPCYDLWSPVLNKAPFDINLVGHTHDFQYHPAGTAHNNPFPVVVGGGPGIKKATMLVLSKSGKKMTLKVLNTEGKEMQRIDL